MTSFVERQREAFTEAAVTEAKRLLSLRKAVAESLRLRDRERLGEIVELDPTTIIAEVHNTSFGTVWAAVVDGKRVTNEWFTTRWVANLVAIGHRHGASREAGGYAAKVLDVPLAQD